MQRTGAHTATSRPVMIPDHDAYRLPSHTLLNHFQVEWHWMLEVSAIHIAVAQTRLSNAAISHEHDLYQTITAAVLPPPNTRRGRTRADGTYYLDMPTTMPHNAMTPLRNRGPSTRCNGIAAAVHCSRCGIDSKATPDPTVLFSRPHFLLSRPHLEHCGPPSNRLRSYDFRYSTPRVQQRMGRATIVLHAVEAWMRKFQCTGTCNNIYIHLGRDTGIQANFIGPVTTSSIPCSTLQRQCDGTPPTCTAQTKLVLASRPRTAC